MDSHPDALREAIAAWGGEFTGRSWLLVMRASEPLEEVVLVAAADAQVYARSAAPRPTGVKVALVETEDGPVVLLRLRLFDRPANPLELEVMLNPLAEDGGDLLTRLQSQDTLQVLFFDRHHGASIGRRILPVSADFRDGIAFVLDRVSTYEATTPERWERAIAAVRAHLS